MVVPRDKRNLNLDEEDWDDGYGIEGSKNISDKMEIAEREDEDEGVGAYL